MTLKKDMSIFIKINSFGVFFTILIVSFIFIMGFYSMSHTQYHYVLTYTDDTPKVYPDNSKTLQLFSIDFAPLLGLLSGGFYLHNITIPILKNAKNKTKKVRDTFWVLFRISIVYGVWFLGILWLFRSDFPEYPTY